MARKYCATAPIHITIGNQDKDAGIIANLDIKQHCYVLGEDREEKYDLMKSVLSKACHTERGQEVQQKILIFCAKKRGVDKLARKMNQDPSLNFTILAIHGDKVQNQREKALNIFKIPLGTADE
jgi:superfamily II DNA/RNA helicase